MTKENLQWHPAFFVEMQIEFAEEAELLIFESEHSLGTKPKQIDVLIIKKFNDVLIQRNIGQIFRRYNIVEYKSPTDYLSIDDFYLVYAYACLYKSDTNHVDEISAEEITIAFGLPKAQSRKTVCFGYEYHCECKCREIQGGDWYVRSIAKNLF